MKEYFERYLERIDSLGGDARELVFENPVTEQDVNVIEDKLGYVIPGEFRNVLLSVSSHCEFKWFLPDSFILPPPLTEIFCGDIHWGIDFILPFNESKENWIKEVFSNPNDEYNKVWHRKFVFQEVGNGDYISIDLVPENYGKIVYLSHDDGGGHGFVMANSFKELLNNWIKLGCVGGEDWQWLPFCKDESSGIDPYCENAKIWYETIGLL